MSKVLARDPDAVAKAVAFLGECGVEEPRDIDLRAMAGKVGARIVFEPLVNQSAHVLIGDGNHIICIAERLRGTPRARFDAGHEIAHIVLGHSSDEIGVCTGDTERTNAHRWRLERSANDFSVETLMPARQFAAHTAHARPTFYEVRSAARVFRTGLRTTAIRFVELCPEPCAVVLSINGQIEWSVENHPFALKIVKKRALDARSHALAAARGEAVSDEPVRVPALAWHTKKRDPKIELWEHTVPDDEVPGATLTWLWHAA